jgi:glycosyltransferase involved in cell wall biosynthesis
MRRWITTSAVWAGPFTIGTGIKTKLLEAMATNTPAVVTPVGGRGLDLASGTFLVGSSDEALAAHLCSVLEDDGLARALGERGGDYVRGSYDWPAVGRALERVYEEVVAEKRLPAR